MDITKLNYSIVEAGERLGGLSRSSVLNLIKAGELKTIKLLDRRMVPATEIDALQARRMQVVRGEGS